MTETIQVNVSMEAETAALLDKLARESGYENRSPFVRWLIRQEAARRYSQPNPAVTVAEAQAAAEGAK